MDESYQTETIANQCDFLLDKKIFDICSYGCGSEFFLLFHPL